MTNPISTITAQNFVLTGSRDPLDLAMFDMAMAHLSTDPATYGHLLSAADRGANLTINHSGVNQYDPNTNTVSWDPTKAIASLHPDFTPGGVVSPEMTLIHEIGHLLDPDFDGHIQILDVAWENGAELFAAAIENQAERALGEPERDSHYMSVMLTVDNPTIHTAPDANGGFAWAKTMADGSHYTGPGYIPEASPTVPSFGPPGTGTGATPDPWEPGGGFSNPPPGSDPGNGGGADEPGGGPGGDPWEGDGTGFDPGGFGGGGGGGGGSSGGGNCVHVASYLPGGKRAGDIVVGSVMQLADGTTLERGEGVVSYSMEKEARGFRIVTERGASLVCSESAPIPTKRGLLPPEKLLGEYVAVRWDEGRQEFPGWERVVKIEAVGIINVQHITVGDKCFWAGEKPGAYILHHNSKVPGGDGGGNLVAGHGRHANHGHDGANVVIAPHHEPIPVAVQLVGIAPIIDHSMPM